MQGPSPAAAAEPTASPEAVRIVLFGMPAAGKSSLLGALGQAAQAQEHLLDGRLSDPTHGIDELRQRLYDESPRRTADEVVPYLIDYEPFPHDGKAAPGKHVPAVLIDCDGRVANDLLVRRQALDDKSPEGTLAHEVVQADTLVLVIDASAPPAQVEADFTEFVRFLQQMEQGRGRRAEVAGLPVFLVLTKCDLLATPGDSAADWIEHIEDRKRDVDTRFRDFLARKGKEGGGPHFGAIDLHLWATAVKRPALAGVAARPREPFGVAELFRQCLDEATVFRDRRRRAARRLLWTAGGAAGVVVLLVGVAVAQMVGGGGHVTPLQSQVEALLFGDKPTAAERLHAPAPELRRRLGELERVAAEPGFFDLPSDEQNKVRERITELRSYLEYFDRLRQQRRPGDVASEKELQELEDHLKVNLALPSPEWQETEAGKLHDERLKDTRALITAADRARAWYQDEATTATDLWTFRGLGGGLDGAGIDWQAWAARVEELTGPEHKPPFGASEPVRGSPSGLTYGSVLRFAKVVEARVDWESDRGRLARLADVTAALGIAVFKGKPPVLVIPADATLELARARRRELQTAYPRFDKEFTLDGLPDAARPKVQQAAHTNYENLLRPAQAEVLRQLQQAGTGTDETVERWAPVRRWLEAPRELAEWRVVALVLDRLHDLDPADPVDALAAFLGKTTFTISLSRVTVEVPDSLRARPTSGANFSIYHPASSGDKPALVLEPTGEGERRPGSRYWTYNFRLAEGTRINYQPGQRLWASLPMRDDLMLTWALARSSFAEFECLRRPPRLHKADEKNTEGSKQESIRLILHPEDGVPRVPDLMPVVKLGP